MKFKTTKKHMRNNYHKIIGLGYCSGQSLLKYQRPIAYSVRVEGWACDYYDINGILISTGYAPLKSKNTFNNYDILTLYDDKAEKIVYNNQLSYDEKKILVDELLMDYIKEVISND